jgi:putative oxidoreductase
MTTNRTDATALVGRVLIAVPFLLSGIGKLAAPAATQAYIAAVGLPVPVAAYLGATGLELIGSILLIAGYQVRIVASALAVFTLMTAVLFHNNFADQNQMIHFLKNFAIMGGLLQVAAYGSGRFSLDHRWSRLAGLPSAALTPAR